MVSSTHTEKYILDGTWIWWNTIVMGVVPDIRRVSHNKKVNLYTTTNIMYMNEHNKIFK